MNINFVDLKKNYASIKDEISTEIASLFDKCDFINGGKVTIFENNFATFLNVRHFIGCANGTDALEIAVKCLDLTANDEIIVQGNTYIASCLGVLNNQAKLVLCDIVKDTYMIDIDLLEQKITRNTKAIMVVHLYGLMPDMDKITALCRKYNLYLIEDCAQAHGASWNGQKAGTFGDIACFSFYPGKNLGAYGDGGGIATNNSEYNEKIRKLINLGNKTKYHHEIIGRNSRLDTIQAAFLNVKLGHLDKWNALRRAHATTYNIKLAEVGDIILPQIAPECIPVFHLYVIRTKYRDELKQYLEDHNIHCFIHYPISIAETEAMQAYNYNSADVQKSIMNSREILSLPMYPELELPEIEYICDTIRQFYMEKNMLVIRNLITENKPGELHCINNINFTTRRFFYINNFSTTGVRGFHANLNFNEFIIVLEGAIRLKLIDVNLKEEIRTISKNSVFLVSPMKWIEYEILDVSTNILCLCDKSLNESKVEADFDKFKAL
jgi:dTDP-4-amino-4,6-dideoxygalactose transaminase